MELYRFSHIMSTLAPSLLVSIRQWKQPSTTVVTVIFSLSLKWHQRTRSKEENLNIQLKR